MARLCQTWLVVRAYGDSVAVTTFFRNPATGKLVVAQPPNPPLWVFLAAALAARVPGVPAAARGGLSFTARASLLVWAALEVTRGESPFRRVLGAVVGALTVASAVAALSG